MPDPSTRKFSLSEISELRKVLQLQSIDPQVSAGGAAAFSTQSNTCSAVSTGNCTGAALLEDLVAAIRPQSGNG